MGPKKIYEFLQEQKKEEEMREENMKLTIASFVNYLKDSGCLSSEYFHIMHINNFFITTEDVYYPAELALVRFNLQEGVLPTNVYNVMVKPGVFPMGYTGMAKKQSDSTHKIPYLNPEPSNLEDVTANVFKFLRESAKLGNTPLILPPIYVKDDFLKMVRSVMYQLADKYGYDPDELRIYSLSYLLFKLHNVIAHDPVWFSVSPSLNELDRDVYDYTPEIPCDYHRYEADNPVHCSRSHVIRMAYIVCDNVCADLGITLVPGCHVPIDAITTKVNFNKMDATGAWGDIEGVDQESASTPTSEWREVKCTKGRNRISRKFFGK